MDNIKNKNEILLFTNSDELFIYTARDFQERALKAVKENGIFNVVLSGGNTPKSLFDILTQRFKDSIPWQSIRFFFSDERYVPIDSKENNYHMAKEYLFSKLPIKPENVYPIPTHFKDPKDAAREYEHTLRKIFFINDNKIPSLDLIYLGLGDDGHTASLMPHSEIVAHYALNPAGDAVLVVSLYVSHLGMYRITLTPSLINAAKSIQFLVSGEKKAKAVKEVLYGPYNPNLYPAQLIQPVHTKSIWCLDLDAGNQL